MTSNTMIKLFLSMSYTIIWMLFVIPSFVFSDNELHTRCAGPFECGNQKELFYPFWKSGREGCGHPDFKLDCSSKFPELNISSVKFRIVDVNYYSGVIRLARSDYMDSLCPHDPLNMPFNETVLPFDSNTELLTIYYNCSPDIQRFVPVSVGDFSCDDETDGDDGRSYYVTRNQSSSLLPEIRGPLYNFRVLCRNVSIPASGPALIALQNHRSRENLKKALEAVFQLRLNQECWRCAGSEGACGFNQSSNGFTCYYKHKDAGLSTRAVAGISTACVLAVAFLLAAVLLDKRRKTQEAQHTSKGSSHYLGQQYLKVLNRQKNLQALIPLKLYSYAQVKRITNSFEDVIGRGGFGIVYRGTLCDGRRVAVKVLNNSKGNNGEDFLNEVASISQTSHVNIVTLLGFCSEGSKRAIIYEFLENGSLHKFISSKRSLNMDWRELYGIMLGVAHGLEYLHHGCRTRIVHFDIKPQNVLLDDNLCPKLSDFGLAKLCERKESMLSLLDTRGTIGYIAPEVFSRVYGRVSHKSDVYSYGMLVLEMIGAKNKPENADTTSSTSSMYFPEWIYKDLEKGGNGRFMENGISNAEEEIVRKMTLVGLWCIQSWPSDRPSMNRVVEMIEGNLNALELPPKPVLELPAGPFQESSMISDNSISAEICSMNIA